jgi:hypothetical protein
MAIALVPCACITGFKHPLGAVEEGFIESMLLGTWRCSSTDDPTPFLITFMDFDGKQYYLLSSDGGSSEPSHLRGVATRIEDVAFLSVRALDSDGDGEWMVLEYALSDADHLTFRLVDSAPFEDIVDDPPSVRERLAWHLQYPETFVDLLSCARQRPGGLAGQ